jgi:hypothetical protein
MRRKTHEDYMRGIDEAGERAAEKLRRFGATVFPLSADADCRICGERWCDGSRHERAAVGDEDCRGGAHRP